VRRVCVSWKQRPAFSLSLACDFSNIMRLGKPSKKSRAWKKAGLKGKPQHVTTETVIGQVSSDLISTYFAPKMIQLAEQSLERYATETMIYQDQLKELKNATEAEIGVEGSTDVLQQQQPPLPPPKPLYHSQHRIDELTSMFQETSDHFFAKAGGWKVHANAAKFERMLDEKYGVFRPFITEHPEIEQFVRTVQRKYAMGYFSPLRQGPPPIPRTTAVILLFMLQRGKMRWEITLLAALFLLIGLQPWALVGIVSLIRFLLYNRKRKPVGTMKKRIVTVKPYYTRREGGGDDEEDDNVSDNKYEQELLLQPVGSALGDKEQIDRSDYDTIVLGSRTRDIVCGCFAFSCGTKSLGAFLGQRCEWMFDIPTYQ